MKNSCGRRFESAVQALRTSVPVSIFLTSEFTYLKRGHMTRKRLGAVLSALMPLLLGIQLWGIPAHAEPASAILHGTTQDARGVVVSQVQVTIHSVDDNADQVVVSDWHGDFVVGNLTPGHYQLVATKSGFASSQVTYLAVAAGDDLRFDLRLSGTPAGPSTSVIFTPAASAPADPEAPSPIVKELDEMKARIAELEAALKSSASPEQPAAASAPEMDSSSSMSMAANPAQGQAPAESSTAAAAAQAPAASTCCNAETTTKSALFSFDNTWENNVPRTKDTPLATKYFTPEIRADANFIEDYNQPKDHTMVGSTEEFRNGEFQLEQLSVGGDLRIDNVRARLLTMQGLFASTTPRNDASAGVGQWNLNDAYKYFSEAWGGYHFNVSHGLNIDAGIFVSYIGLFSYYNFDNWAYQPSYVSSNTPWFFNGIRIQWFPTDKLKIEPWVINGWQSYAKYNGKPGLGGQIKWIPKEWISLTFNNYGMGTDTLGVPGESRIHTDDSVEVRYFNQPDNLGIDKSAFTFTFDAGCEYGGTGSVQVNCHNDKNGHPKQSMVGWMLYNRTWFHKDLFAMTVGGGVLDNPGRYLTLLQPINGATAVSGSPYFPEAPGLPYKAWDSTITFDYMPSQFITFRFETGYRYANVPYFAGREGVTPPGGNVAPVASNASNSVGTAASYICTNGTTSGVSSFSPSAYGLAIDGVSNVSKSCFQQYGSGWSLWQPDLRKNQWANSIAIMVKF